MMTSQQMVSMAAAAWGWVVGNKEWIFQGIGVPMAMGLMAWFGRVAWIRHRNAPSEKSSILPTTEGVATRLAKTLSLMNEDSRSTAITVADLAAAMQLEAPAELELFILGKRNPTIDFIRRFSERFGVNHEWLLSGRSAPFLSSEELFYYPSEYLSRIIDLQPQTVYFVRSKGAVGEALIVVKVDELKYITFPMCWHISEHVGAGGCSQMVDFYRLVISLRDTGHSYTLLGRMIDERTFDKLKNGLVYPRTVVEGGSLNHWWDDLTDLDNKWTTDASCIGEYVGGFVFARKVIRQSLLETQTSRVNSNEQFTKS